MDRRLSDDQRKVAFAWVGYSVDSRSTD